VKSAFVLMGSEYVPLERAVVDARTQAFNYGASVFEGIRGYKTAAGDDVSIFRLSAHLERLHRSGHVVGISLPASVAELAGRILELVRRNEFHEDVYVRPIAYKGVPNSLGIVLDDAPDEFLVYTFALGEYLPRDRPLRVCVSSWSRISDNAVPARCKIGGSYINPGLAKTEAVRLGFDDCLMLTADGTVAEGTTSNLFLVQDGRLVTPAPTEDILIGITRDSVMQLASSELAVTVEQRPVDRSELYQADEAFLCGTGAEVAAIGEIDGRSVGDGRHGEMTTAIRDLYLRAARGELSQYDSWLSPVYGSPASEPTATTDEAEASLIRGGAPR
jgi:branched-chain amino acid aminotransferase